MNGVNGVWIAVGANWYGAVLKCASIGWGRC